ncbi:MAG: DUF4124 domain-containing protein [Candidatus Thiodiazotropha endolucinida]
MLDTTSILPRLFTQSLLFVLLMAGLQLQAEVYKWVDEQGRVHFSDRPVTGESTEIRIREQESPQPAAGQHDRQMEMRRMLDVYAEERAEKKEAKQKQLAERKRRKQNCVRAKDRYNSHLRATGIYNLGNDGERRYLSEQERARHIKRLKADITRWCR